MKTKINKYSELIQSFPINSRIAVRSLWNSDNRIVWCKVVEHWPESEGMMLVQPLAGNSHHRIVQAGRHFEWPDADMAGKHGMKLWNEEGVRNV
jgi:hypothetical protein